MAVIVTHALAGPLTKIPPYTEFSSQLSAFGAVDNSPPVQQYDHSHTGYGTIDNNLPIEGIEQSIAGYKAPSFLDDYYYRIHIRPGIVDVGNLLSSQTKTVEVWNSYFTPELLSSVSKTGTEGLTLTEPFPAPTTYAALESRIHSLVIGSSGPPNLEALYVFNFQDESPSLSVIGKRVVIWPFLPEVEHKEELEWKTDILEAFSAEQRIALRRAPRQTFTYKFYLDEQQYSRAKTICGQWAHRVYGIPVWSEYTKIESGLSSGATFISLDTSNADYRDNDLIFIFNTDLDCQACETLTIQSDGINLKLPLSKSWGSCYVMPIRYSRTLNGMQFNRSSNLQIELISSFQTTLQKDLSQDGSTLYRTVPVLLERTTNISDVNEKIIRPVDTFDNGSGPLDVDVITNWFRFVQIVQFVRQSRSSLWDLRKWIHSRRGRQKSFWLPSWNNDLIILSDQGPSSSSLIVKNIGYTQYYTIKDIMVRLKDGTNIFSRILSGSVDTDGNEILSLSSAIGTAFNSTDVEFTCFMSHVRFDSDLVSFQHGEAELVKVSIPVIEVPENGV